MTQNPSLAPSANGGGGLNVLDDHIYQRLLRERIIFLGSEVKDQNANAICAQLLLLSAEDPEADIFLHINSPGGSVDAGMAIYDTMNYIPNDVATVGMGLAASMGQFLLCAGARGKRFCCVRRCTGEVRPKRGSCCGQSGERALSAGRTRRGSIPARSCSRDRGNPAFRNRRAAPPVRTQREPSRGGASSPRLALALRQP